MCPYKMLLTNCLYVIQPLNNHLVAAHPHIIFNQMPITIHLLNTVNVFLNEYKEYNTLQYKAY